MHGVAAQQAWVRLAHASACPQLRAAAHTWSQQPTALTCVWGMQASTSCLSPQHSDSVESGKRAREGVLADLPLSFAAKLRRTRDLRLRDEAAWPRAAAAAPARCAGTADRPGRLTAAPGAAPYLSSCSGTGGGSADRAAGLAASAPAASSAAEQARLTPERRAAPASPEHGCGPFITGARAPALPRHSVGVHGHTQP